MWYNLVVVINIVILAPVPQLDRGLGYEPRRRGFESLRARQKESHSFEWFSFCFVLTWGIRSLRGHRALRKQSGELFLAMMVQDGYCKLVYGRSCRVRCEAAFPLRARQNKKSCRKIGFFVLYYSFFIIQYSLFINFDRIF